MTPGLAAYGDRALLVELASTQEVVAYAAGLRAAGVRPGTSLVADVVPAARSVLLVAADGVDVADLRAAVAGVEPLAADERSGERPGDRPSDAGRETVVLEVAYDGPDLAEVARLTGLRECEVVAAHTGTVWHVAFAGFAPGFAYLVGGDPRLVVPRRATPRTRVPAGAVGLAGEFSGVYPRASPGGWQLLGTTATSMWDLEREPAALLAPGDRVRFVEAGT